MTIPAYSIEVPIEIPIKAPPEVGEFIGLLCGYFLSRINWSSLSARDQFFIIASTLLFCFCSVLLINLIIYRHKRVKDRMNAKES